MNAHLSDLLVALVDAAIRLEKAEQADDVRRCCAHQKEITAIKEKVQFLFDAQQFDAQS